MKKIIFALTILGSLTSYAAEYTVEVSKNGHETTGKLYGKILHSKLNILIGQNVQVIPTSTEAYEQFKNIQEGTSVLVKGSYDFNEQIKINATSISE